MSNVGRGMAKQMAWTIMELGRGCSGDRLNKRNGPIRTARGVDDVLIGDDRLQFAKSFFSFEDIRTRKAEIREPHAC